MAPVTSLDRPRLARHAGTFAWFGLVAVYATWPLAAHGGTKILGNLGDPLEVAWRLAWGARAVVHQPLHLFDANMFHPESLSLAFSENHLGVGLLVAPVFWATGNALLAYNAAILLVLATAGFAVYLFTWEVTGTRGPAMVAGTAYAVVPFRVSMAGLGHLHVLSIHFAPLVLLVLYQMRRDRAWWRPAVLAVLVAAALWSSFTGAFMTLTAMAIFAIWEVVRLRRRAWPWLWRVGLATVAGLVAALPVLWPYLEVRRDHPDYRHPESELVDLSATAGAYLHPPPGGPVVRRLYRGLSGRFRPAVSPGEKELFPGFWLTGATVVTLGAAAARRKWPAREIVGVCGMLAAVAVVLSFGPRYGARADGLAMPFGAVNALTAGTLLRAPVRLGALALLAMAVAAGIGLSWVPPARRRFVVGASLAALLLEAMPVQVDLVKPPVRTAAHAALARREGAVLGLPTVEWDAQGRLIGTSLARESQHLYLSTVHWRPMTNGWGAYYPPGALAFAAAMADIPSPGAFKALRERNVRTVVVQTGLTVGTRWDGVGQRLAGWPGVRVLGRGTGVVVFDISEAAP